MRCDALNDSNGSSNFLAVRTLFRQRKPVSTCNYKKGDVAISTIRSRRLSIEACRKKQRIKCVTSVSWKG